MRSTLESILGERRPYTAVAAFTCYELAAAMGVLGAVSSARAPAVVLVSAQAAERETGPAVIAALRAVVDRAAVPVSLMLDHAKALNVVDRSFAAGVDSVLADGSHLAFEENVDFTRAVARTARAHGGSVEAELGVITGDEDRRHNHNPNVPAPDLTAGDRVAEFVERTGCDALAVSIGNRHGGPPAGDLDWARLDELRTLSPAPLVLHGASGLADWQLRRAVAGGVAKVNFNTQLRKAWVASLAGALAIDGDRLDVDSMVHEAAQAVAGATDRILASVTGTQAIRA